MRARFPVAFFLLATLPAGCASVAGHAAAPDVRALAIALQSRDLAGIEARIDRPALRAQLVGVAQDIWQSEATRVTGDVRVGSIAGIAIASLGAGVVEEAAEALVQPALLAAIARDAGLNEQSDLPGRTALGFGLLAAGQDRVCAPDRSGNCLLYFSRRPGGWKLTGLGEQAVRQRIGFRAASSR
jgi:hypothetical protein